MKINSYKFLLIILVVVFVVPQIALAAWWNPFSWGWVNRIFHFQQTEQKADITSWNTYKNTKFGVEFKIPSTYKITEYNSETQFSDKNSLLTVDYSWNGTDREVINYKEISVGGEPAKEYDFGKSLDELDSISVTINQQKTIWFYPKNKEFLTKEDISNFNQMLSTFKFTSLSDATANWKTYNKYGVSFKYPNTWNLEESKVGSGTVLLFGYNLSVRISSLYNNETGKFDTFSQVVSRMTNGGTKVFHTVTDVTANKINGKLDVYRYSTEPVGTVSGTAAFFPLDSKSYIAFESSDQQVIGTDIFKQIISTFKFTALTDKTLGWKKYTNEKYGFELLLPSSWGNYTVTDTNRWEGRIIDGPYEGPDYDGPMIFIKNPKLEKENRFVGIPIMVITPDVWKLISEEKVAVSAAPIGPAKIGENNKYVFATPPRYIGFVDDLNQSQIEEVYNIVKTFKVIK